MVEIATGAVTTGKAATRIFVSYRRTDSAAAAGRLADALEQHFGRSSVFMDVDAIPLGVDFTAFLREAVESAEVMLVVIGPNWLEASSADGLTRLHNPHDFVRLEIEAGLAVGLPIVPVLVENAAFPSPEDVPSSLAPLLRRQGITLRHESFRHDAETVIRAISQLLDKTEPYITEPEPTTRGPLQRLRDFVKGSQRSDTLSSGAADSPKEESPLEHLVEIVREARASNVPLARVMAAVEDASSEALNDSKSVEELEEHLLAFPTGTTLPIIKARLEAIFWNRAISSHRPQAFAEYLIRFPHGAHVIRARTMRDQLIAETGGFDPDMPRVFLNYRRSDSQDTADRIFAILSKTMPVKNIVMDVDRESIMPGLPVEPQLRKLVSQCHVMLALIHNKWLDELVRREAQHDSGQQIDFVRVELKCALERGDAMPVVPVLAAESVEHPRAADLPEDIRHLSERSSMRLSRERFDEDVLGLLNKVVAGFRSSRPA